MYKILFYSLIIIGFILYIVLRDITETRIEYYLLVIITTQNIYVELPMYLLNQNN